MGNSLIERLFNYYKTMPKRCVENHSASLLTNYRCHSSILTLTSSLFYEYTLLSRSESQTHPLAPYPLVFTCSSIEKKSLKNLPAEDRNEAKVLVEKFVKEWLKRPRIGLLRKQVTFSHNSRHTIHKPLAITICFCSMYVGQYP